MTRINLFVQWYVDGVMTNCLTRTPALLNQAGARLAITVIDADLNSKEPSTVTVLAASRANADAVTVVLRKVTPYSTTYTGVLDTELADVETDKLWVAAGDTISLEYAGPFLEPLLRSWSHFSGIVND